jgi:S-DNA-T family DNA segregation ATPase FtsK/SpoIIIE
MPTVRPVARAVAMRSADPSVGLAPMMASNSSRVSSWWARSAASAATVLAVWWWRWPASFTRFVTRPVRGKWRLWHYQRQWAAVMTIGRLAPVYQGRLLLPALRKVTSTGYTDRLSVRLVSGQSAADFAARTDNLARGFGAVLCRVRTDRPGSVVLELVRRDALAVIVPALPIPAVTELAALVVGRREDGTLWTVRLQGTHVLLAGSTGAGKASLLWGLIRALLPAMQDGLARVLAADPKLMELAYGRAIFDRHGHYAADPYDIVAMLEQAVTDMQARAAQLAGRHREHTPHRQVPVRGDSGR